MSKLKELLENGQSYWLDNLSRKKITSGEIGKRVRDKGLRGITSNPSIFNKAISNSTEYDAQIEALVKQNNTIQEIYDALTIKDVQDACDILKPVFDESNGQDGFVSLEVSPYLAHDTGGTILEARRLHKAVDRKNCLIKVPGTNEGLPAIEQLLYEGININVTLLFSVHMYAEIAKAYLRALQQRSDEGLPLENIVSFASVFISRIDVLTDQLLAQHTSTFKKGQSKSSIESLKSKAGIATAKLCYQRYEKIFSTKEFEALRLKGAHVQKLLWASTSNKDPLQDDLRYVNSLIGNNTVNTIPDETIALFEKRGIVKPDTICENVAEAEELFAELKEKDVDIDFITTELENEGVKKFIEAYEELMANLALKRKGKLGDHVSAQKFSLGKLEKELQSVYKTLDENQVGKRLFENDPYLWNKDEKQVKEIKHRLGWLSLPEDFVKNAIRLTDFAAKAKEDGFEHAVLLGMGGSSLCSEVTKKTFDVEIGFLELHILDNTSPEAILKLEEEIDIEKTLFIVASKSGGTQETICFFHYFFNRLKDERGKNMGSHFVAITDPGTQLTQLAQQYEFRDVFINNPNLGGRYSALSDFGLLPMALMGIDIIAFLGIAQQMEFGCKGVPAAVNPGISLGAALGTCYRNGRDKITFVLSSSIDSFGYWVEQLLAESTGKENKGLVPINGEVLGEAEVYGMDRVFVHMYLKGDTISSDEKKLEKLEAAGHPVVRIEIDSALALGGEYYRWEVAVAIAGLLMGINPFDQPNVEESKQNTAHLLEAWKRDGGFNLVRPYVWDGHVAVYSGKLEQNLEKSAVGDSVIDFLHQAKDGDYIALLPYFLLTEKRTKLLQEWRAQLRDDLKVATTLLEGPRYLHSTGQLHKGGPNTGLFIILVADEETELPIPTEKFGFDILHQAQPLGDFKSLDDKGRRIIRISLGKDLDKNLHHLVAEVTKLSKQFIEHL